MQKSKLRAGLLLAVFALLAIFCAGCTPAVTVQNEPEATIQPEHAEEAVPATEPDALSRFYELVSLPEGELKTYLQIHGWDMTGAAGEGDLAQLYAAAPHPALRNAGRGQQTVYPERGVFTIPFWTDGADGGTETLGLATVSLTRLGEAGQDAPFMKSETTYADGAAAYCGMQDGYPVVFRLFCELEPGQAYDLNDLTEPPSDRTVYLYGERLGVRVSILAGNLNDYVFGGRGVVVTCRSSARSSDEASGFFWQLRLEWLDGMERSYGTGTGDFRPALSNSDFLLAKTKDYAYILTLRDPSGKPRYLPQDREAYLDGWLTHGFDGVILIDGAEQSPYGEQFYSQWTQKLRAADSWLSMFDAASRGEGERLPDAELTRQTAQEAGFGLTMDVPEPVWGCVSFYQGQPDELWDGSTVFTLRNVVAETMGADGYLWKLNRVSREDFRWQEDVSTINWDDWADRKTSGEAYLLGRTADAVYLLRFGGGTQLFADAPACAEARADFLAAGRAMLQSFLDQNGIEPNPYWQEIYSQYAAG